MEAGSIGAAGRGGGSELERRRGWTPLRETVERRRDPPMQGTVRRPCGSSDAGRGGQPLMDAELGSVAQDGGAHAGEGGRR